MKRGAERLASPTQAGRLRLLEAIETGGSLTAAGRALGLSYRAVWDQVQALNNIYARPLVVARSGGASGGSAVLTAEGQLARRTLAVVQAELETALDRLAERLEGETSSSEPSPVWSFPLRTSARNALRGVITRLRVVDLEAEVALEIAPDVEVIAVISAASAERLQLAVGKPATALIKASFVALEPQGQGLGDHVARNALKGRVVSVETAGATGEVILEVAEGKTLAASLTREHCEALSLQPGAPILASIEPPHVILAVE